MTNRAIIQADFVKFNPVPTRKTVQVICEIPEEMADHTLTVLGGYPQTGQSRPVAIALLKAGTKPAEQTEERPKDVKQHRDWDDVPPTEQAGIRCNEPLFQTWLHRYLGGNDPEFPTEQAVRNYCGVKSRRELNSNADAASHWRHLDMEYQEFLGNRRYQTQLASGPS